MGKQEAWRAHVKFTVRNLRPTGLCVFSSATACRNREGEKWFLTSIKVLPRGCDEESSDQER